MRIRVAVPEAFVDPGVVDAALEAVTRLDESMIRQGHSPTSHDLIKAGAVWRPEPPGDEHFDHGGTIASRGWGDCDDWAPLHAATLRATGEDPGAVARVVPSGPNTYHAIVQRTDGAIDDPSVAAGMKAHRVGGIDDERIQVWACDPHDGRTYEGSLAPTVGPLSPHCGPGIALRRAIVGGLPLFEGRCDVPINGSPLVHVHSYYRRRGHHHRRHVHGSQVPYALSCTAHGATPYAALSGAIQGAILCGDAAELTTSLDKYKMLAAQAGMAGMSPGQVRDALVAQITADVQQDAEATGTHPLEHTNRLMQGLAQEGVIVSGIVVGDFFSDIGHIASGIVHTVSNVVNDVAKVASQVPWGDIIHGVEAAVSVIPGLGTAVSDIVAAAETAYDTAAALLHGNPLEAAIHAAYNFATATIPGAAAIRFILDPVVETLIKLTVGHEPIESAVLDGIIKAVPDSPKVGPVSPQSIASSIAHMIVGHLGVKNTGQAKKPTPITPAVAAHPAPAAVLSAVHAKTPLQIKAATAARLAQQAKRPPPPHAAIVRPVLHLGPVHPALAAAAAHVKPPGVPHAAVHVSTVPLLKPGSPGAPPGATHWTCNPGPGGTWQCKWV